MRVLLGGTFEVLHKGHAKLLRRALRFGEIVIGLSTDKFARRAKRRKVIPFEKRKAALWKFFGKQKSRVQIFPLSDRFGVAVSDENADAIVVSEETERAALEINKLRKKKGLRLLKVVVVPLAKAYDGRKISCERILRGETDADGNEV